MVVSDTKTWCFLASVSFRELSLSNRTRLFLLRMLSASFLSSRIILVSDLESRVRGGAIREYTKEKSLGKARYTFNKLKN